LTEGPPRPAPTTSPSPIVIAEAGRSDEEAPSDDSSDVAASGESEQELDSEGTTTSRKETSDRALFALSSSTFRLIALACLIAGVGVLTYAFVLWKREQKKVNGE
jgi:hypothetical protein